jgi:thymidylate synthase
MNDFDLQYRQILQDILAHGFSEKNERTGEICHSLPGVTMRFDLLEGFPLLSLRKIPLKVFIAEQVWFLMGEKDISWLQQFTKIWDDFAEDRDGVQEIEAAYGYRWRRHFGRDQIDKLLNLLSQEPSSRHGVVMMWDPGDDGLGGKLKKNVPCPFTFTAQILGGRLHLHLIIRSNDMMLGNPHDTAGFALLNYILAEKLGIDPGILTISISNAHIYDIHRLEAETLVSRECQQKAIKFMGPKNAFARAEKGDENLVEEIFQALKAEYVPQEGFGRMKIVL